MPKRFLGLISSSVVVYFFAWRNIIGRAAPLGAESRFPLLLLYRTEEKRRDRASEGAETAIITTVTPTAHRIRHTKKRERNSSYS